MADSVLDAIRRLCDEADEQYDCGLSGCGHRARAEVSVASIRAALAVPPSREARGGPTTPWAEPYASDPAFLAADDAATTLARSLRLTGTEAECMQRGAHELWRLGWRPAGALVGREALVQAVYGVLRAADARIDVEPEEADRSLAEEIVASLVPAFAGEG